MNLTKGLIGAVVGAILGALIWIAIGYYTGFEVGYIAWGIGLLAGLGMVFGGTDQPRPVAGVLAAAIAIVAIVGAKYAVGVMIIDHQIAEIFDSENLTNEAIATIAFVIADEHRAQGQELEWPPDAESPDVPWEDSFPPGIWQEASTRWDALSADEREGRREAVRVVREAQIEPEIAEVREDAFLLSFGGFDLLWFGLAAVTAFKVGSSAKPQSPENEPTTDDKHGAEEAV